MIHTVHIDDSTTNGKRMLEDMRQNNEGIEFEENNISEVAEPMVEYVKSGEKIINDTENPPAGYVTGDEFEKMVKEKVTKYYKTNLELLHTVHIDDSTANGKRIMQSLRKNKTGVEFEQKQGIVAEPSAEYMTSAEFWKEADKRISRICKTK